MHLFTLFSFQPSILCWSEPKKDNSCFRRNFMHPAIFSIFLLWDTEHYSNFDSKVESVLAVLWQCHWRQYKLQITFPPNKNEIWSKMLSCTLCLRVITLNRYSCCLTLRKHGIDHSVFLLCEFCLFFRNLWSRSSQISVPMQWASWR